jgi:N-acetylglucosaminylphosphatidylinositol deacetylase
MSVQQQCDFSMWAQRRVALVVAHPDDEAMFFTPTIASLRAQQCAIFVLCLSTGNFYGLGATRRQEMQASCSDVLGVDHCTVLDDPRLQDGAATQWPAAAVADCVDAFLIAHRIDTVVTFDEGGVSGHRDHCAVYFGALELAARRLEPTSTLPALTLFTLDSVGLLRKYSGVLDALYLWLVPPQAPRLALHNPTPALVYRAMCAHASQLMWFRYLFILFSRYTFVNTLHHAK